MALKIAIKRFSMDMTQQDLAKKSGVSVNQISKIERGVIKLKNVSVGNAYALAKALDSTVEDLFIEDKSNYNGGFL